MTRGVAGRALGLGLALVAAALPARGGAQAADEPAPSLNPWSLQLSAEIGAGNRDVDLPMAGIVQRIRPGLFPAFGLGFELDYGVSRSVALGLLVRYQSSLAHGIAEQHTDGSAHPFDVRSQRLEVGLAPRFQLDGSGTWTVAAAAGCSFHVFRPDVHHLVTPAYSLIGPHLRAGLQFAPWGGTIRLFLAPEVQGIVHVSRDLRDRGVAASGLGAGGEAGMELVVGRWAFGAVYRETRVWIDSAQARGFEDIARFVTARVTGAL